MATLGHVAVGLAAARFTTDDHAPTGERVRASVVLAAISMAPDLDTIAFALRVPYVAPWGHRGAAHSLTFTLVVGAFVGLLALPGPRRLRRATLAGLTAASHPLLDTLTDGGLGMALLWPFTNARYFAPWRPIPVAPIGPAFLSTWGLRVTLAELLMFSPVLLYAFWPRRRTAMSR